MDYEDVLQEDVLQKAHQKLSELKAGVLFINQVAKKIQLALSLVEEKLNEVDFVIWIAPSGFCGISVPAFLYERNQKEQPDVPSPDVLLFDRKRIDFG